MRFVVWTWRSAIDHVRVSRGLTEQAVRERVIALPATSGYVGPAQEGARNCSVREEGPPRPSRTAR